MLETIQAAIARETFIHWIEDIYRPYMDALQSGGKVLRLHHDGNIFPELDILFFGSPKNFQDTVEIGGIYDHRAHSFHFMTSRMASIVDGLSEEELHTGNGTSEIVYAEIRQYAEKAVKEWGYQYTIQADADYAKFYREAQSALLAMTKYAALLSSRGDKTTVGDMRELAEKMLHFWRDPIYDVYERGYEAVERQYLEQFDQASTGTFMPAHAVQFSGKDAKTIFRGLALQAMESEDNEDELLVRQCCRLAKRLGEEYPQEMVAFHGDFTPIYDEQLASPDTPEDECIYRITLFDKLAMLFDCPVPEEWVPRKWNVYHLSGTSLTCPARLSKSMPESGYVGTVLSPYVLIHAGSKTCEITETLKTDAPCSLREFRKGNIVPYCQTAQTAAPSERAPKIGELCL